MAKRRVSKSSPSMPISIPIVTELGEPVTAELFDAGGGGARFYVTPIHFRATSPRTAAAAVAAMRTEWTAWEAAAAGREEATRPQPRAQLQETTRRYIPGPRSKTKDERFDRAERDAAATDVDDDDPWPFAPAMELHRNLRGCPRRLLVSWDVNKPLKRLAGRLRAFELYVGAVPWDDGPRVPCRRTCTIAASAMSVGCLIDSLPDGYDYFFGMRAVDVHGRCTMFRAQAVNMRDSRP